MLLLLTALLGAAFARPAEDPGPTLALRELPDLPDALALWPALAARGSGDDAELAALWTVEREAGGHALHRARWRRDASTWSPAETLAEGDDWFVNWADFPQLALRPDGVAVATWLERAGEGGYAYGVRVQVEGPDTKSEARWLHDDRSATEHGFVSLVPLSGGRVFAAWLDGRATADRGPMALRAATIAPDGTPGESFELDGRTCDCCQTDAALLADGRVLVAWRDRGDDEVRDVSWSLGHPDEPEGWTAPRRVREDGWAIPGCPVNGPAVCARGAGAAVAWFTVERGEAPRVFLVQSARGAAFAEPVRIDGGQPLGRVDVGALADGTLVVAWLEGTPGAASWCARAVAPDGSRGPVLELAAVTGERGDGFLRMAPLDGGLACAFVEGGRGRVVRVGRP